VSSFDDEFGLFGDEVPVEEDERRSTLGARKIASGETIIDEIEPEDEPAPRRRAGGRRLTPAGAAGEAGPLRRFPRRPTTPREPLAPEVAHARAVDLLDFLAKKLVANPDAVIVELHPDARGAVLELEVDPDDIGKVIGRGGRVAQALRTLVRAGAEGRVTIDIVDAEDDEDDDQDDEAEEEESVTTEVERGGEPPAE
jgi:predicted RNA-binding protein YlqC (UPF0109 family)